MFPLLFSLAHAGTLAGVTLPDTATVAGQTLALNGMGLREKYTIDVYVGGLYLPTPTRDGAAAVALDAPKRVVMHFTYRKVTREQMLETFLEGFGDQATGPQKPNVDKLLAVVPEAMYAGDEISFDYAPGVGTTMSIKGKAVATVPGAEFMRMVFGVWLGARPPSAALKAGMLGTG